MANDARSLAPAMLNHAQTHDWLGRQIMEVGCGTGEGILALEDSPYTLIGVDRSEEMLNVARAKSNSAQWELGDIRQLSDIVGQQDMILAIDVINEVAESLKDLQAVFEGVYNVLREGSLFMFDMHTMAGLIQRGTEGERLIYDTNGITMMTRSSFDYERLAAVHRHITFQKGDNDTWSRMDTERVLRAYPLQAVARLLQGRVKFQQVRLLTLDFVPLDPRVTVDRVMFAAKK